MNTAPTPLDRVRSSHAPSLAGSVPLSDDEIEQINAHGPFNHSVWRGRGVVVTHEAGLAGRAEFLSSKIRETICKQFSVEQLAKMSIVDVGCYDGWLLESLSDLPFARMVGIEPRLENIERGRCVRRILQIPSRVEYRIGEVENLKETEVFDIVLCCGVLHHLESIATGLERLRSICGRMIVLEAACLPSRHLTAEMRHDLELKDLVYQYKPTMFGVSGQKYESRHSPGSGVRFSVVNVPSVASLQMHLEVLGFCPATIVADWETYRQALPHFQRPAQVVCLSAVVDSNVAREREAQEDQWMTDYEARMTRVVLPAALVRRLHGAICDKAPPPSEAELARLVKDMVGGQGGQGGPSSEAVSDVLTDATQREIVAALPHAPLDKVRLEYAKCLLAQGATQKAIEELRLITHRLNSDWRSCYRAFYLLWWAAHLLGDQGLAHCYRERCMTCNPNFPSKLFEFKDEFKLPNVA